MAYNIFKRPMFKRGGSAKGQGIMSHVEPRVNAAFGYFGAGQQIDPQQLANFRRAEAERLNRIAAGGMFQGRKAQPQSIPYVPGAGFSFLGSGINQDTRPMTPPAGIGPADTSGGGIFSTLFGRKVQPQSMSYRPGFSAFGLGVRQGDAVDTRDMPLYDESETEGGAVDVSKIIAQKSVNKEEIDKNLEKSGTGKPATKEGSYEESDMRSAIEKEADMLKDLLGPAISKGEKALLIAKALETPGSISDKLAVARDEGMKLAAGKKKQDRAAILTAYKYAKEKELKEIAAGKKSSTEALFSRYAELGVKKNRTPKEQKEYEALDARIGGDKASEYAVAQLTLMRKNRLIEDAQDDIRKYKSKVESGAANETEKRKYDEALEVIKRAETLAKQAGLPGYKEGGRVNLAEGANKDFEVADPMKEMNLETDVNVEADQAVPMKPVQKVSYQDLRSRLPKEITNDIVQLIANSEEALQDFAYIKTQEDINDFNVKYGVNLVLPPQTI